MALNFGAQAQPNNVRPLNNAQREPAKTWLNIGMTVPVQQDDGTFVDTFVTMLGIPLDDVQMPQMRGNSATYAQVVQAKQSMLRAILGRLEGIEPGAEEEVHGFEVQIRKVGEKAEAEATPAALNVMDIIAKRLSGKAA